MKQCHLIIATTNSSQKIFENLLIKLFNLKKISIEELIREKIVNDFNSKLAKQINFKLQNGEIIPNKIIIKLLREKLNNLNSDILITNYPKDKKQYNQLIKLLFEYQIKISKLWILELSNIDFLLNLTKDIVTKNEIKIKFKKSEKYIKEIRKIIREPKITTIIEFKYPVNWDDYFGNDIN